MNLGVIRKLDQNGRVQIPSEIRETLGLNNTTPLNVYVENGKIIVSPINRKEE